MGMWQGMLEGLKMVEEEQRLEKEREERKAELEAERAFRERQYQENREFRERQFAADQEAAAAGLQLQRQRLGIELYPLLRENSTNSSELATLGNELQGYFGEDSPIVTSLIGSGDVEGVSRVLGDIRTGYQAAQEEGRGQQFLETVRVTLENEAVIEAARVGELDSDALQQAIGMSLDEIGLPTTYTIPGSVVAPPIVHQPRGNIEDITQIEERIGEISADLAREEVQRLQRSLARINDFLTSGNIPEEVTETDLRQAQITAGDRLRLITDALDSASGENASYFDLRGIYGTNVTQEVLATSTKAVSEESLSPVFRGSLGVYPVAITSEAHARTLLISGAIVPSTPILYEGQIITAGDLADEGN